MAELEPFAVGGENHRVVADHIAAAQAGEADRRRFARAPVMPSRPRRGLVEVTARPAAAASPSARAVPDGASTLWR